MWQGEPKWCKSGWKRVKRMRAGEAGGPAPNLAVPRSVGLGLAGKRRGKLREVALGAPLFSFPVGGKVEATGECQSRLGMGTR